MSVATRFEPQRLHDVAQLGALSAQPLPCSHGEWAQPRPTSKRYCIAKNRKQRPIVENFTPRCEVATLRPAQTRLTPKWGILPWGLPVICRRNAVLYDGWPQHVERGVHRILRGFCGTAGDEWENTEGPLLSIAFKQFGKSHPGLLICWMAKLAIKIFLNRTGEPPAH